MTTSVEKDKNQSVNGEKKNKQMRRGFGVVGLERERRLTQERLKQMSDPHHLPSFTPSVGSDYTAVPNTAAVHFRFPFPTLAMYSADHVLDLSDGFRFDNSKGMKCTSEGYGVCDKNNTVVEMMDNTDGPKMDPPKRYSELLQKVVQKLIRKLIRIHNKMVELMGC